MTKRNKIVLFTTFLVGIMLLPGAAFAETSEAEQIEALTLQIAELLKTVETLQAQVLSPATAVIETPASAVFARNLTIGSRGEDVRELQKLLNNDPRTRIAEDGPGSLGQETTYFGPLTADAVTRFQELYAGDILSPVGLSEGTGYVGPSTLKKVGELLAVESDTTTTLDSVDTGTIADSALDVLENTTPSETTTTNSAADDVEIVTTISSSFLDDTLVEINGGREIIDDLFPGRIPGTGTTRSSSFFISRITDELVQPGDIVHIIGTGFSETGNSIRLGNVVLTHPELVEEGVLSFVVPDIAPGVYQMIVSNGTYDSHLINLVITVENPPGITIDNVTPGVISYLSRVTIFADNLTPTGNLAVVDGVEFRNLASPDGKSISLTFVRPRFDRDNFSQEILDILGPTTINQLESIDPNLSQNINRPTFLYVMNANGRSTVYATTFK